MIRRISHVGVVVEDLMETLNVYERVLHLKPRAIVDALDGKVRAAFVPVGDDEIELLQPIAPNVPLMQYLRKHGSAIHHISLATDDIESDVERMRKDGVVFDRERPTVGAHGTRIIFTDPKSTSGIPIELIEEQAR
jgi:methylmalonyl-CoA epimerase